MARALPGAVRRAATRGVGMTRTLSGGVRRAATGAVAVA